MGEEVNTGQHVDMHTCQQDWVAPALAMQGVKGESKVSRPTLGL